MLAQVNVHLRLGKATRPVAVARNAKLVRLRAEHAAGLGAWGFIANEHGRPARELERCPLRRRSGR